MINTDVSHPPRRTYLEEPVGSLHSIGEGDGFTQDCWRVDGHDVRVRIGDVLGWVCEIVKSTCEVYLGICTSAMRG